MTRRQRLHYMWLVIMNASKMADECECVEDASRMIKRASDVRARLGLNTNKIPDWKKVRQLRSAMNAIPMLPTPMDPMGEY